MIEFLFGTKPGLYLSILLVVLFLWFVCVPLIEWAIDLGERTAARGVYRKHSADAERERLDAVVDISARRQQS